MKNPLHYLRQFPLGDSQRVARAILAVVGIVLVGILLFADNPWDARKTGRFKVADYVAVWFWLAAAGNLLLVAALFATAKFWAVRLRSRPAVSTSARPRWFFPFTLLAALVLVVTAWPRMSQSLWHDEASRTKSTMVGYHQVRDDGSLRFKTVKWQDAMFESRLPNHVFQSILSKLSHDSLKGLFRAGPNGLSETALRLPSLIAGVLAVIGTALLLAAVGEPVGGVVAAWLLALHPWFLRYASEARGYAIVMALLPFLIIFFLCAVRTGKARWWVAMALAQTAMVYSYALSVYIPIVLALLAPVYIFASRKDGVDAPRALRHWFVTGVCSAALFIQLFLPCAPQLLRYLASEKGHGLGNVMGPAWMANFASQAWIGIPWTNSFRLDSDYAELMPWASANASAFAVLLAICALVAVLGIVRAAGLGRNAILAFGVLLLPAPLSFLETKLHAGFLYDWYLVYLVVGLCALAGVGLSAPIAWARTRGMRTVAAVACALAVASYGYATQPQRAELMANSLHPSREAVLVARPTLDPHDPRQDRVLTTSFHSGPLWYDPFLKKSRTVAELKDLMQRADAENKALFVTLGYLETTACEHPIKWSLVTKSGLFEQAAFLRGFHPELSFQVFRYRPGSAASFDFSPYHEDIATGRKFYHD